MSGTLFIVSAPSGAGKTTLIQAVLKNLGSFYSIERVITYTSKTPRHTEVDGVDYYFISSQLFEQKIQEGFFLEWSGAYGNYYGTPVTVIKQLESGKSLVVIPDRSGARELVRRVSGAVTLWITVEHLGILKDRLLGRGTESPEQLQKRLSLAQDEMMDELKNRLFKHHILNSCFNTAQKNIENIIIERLQNRATIALPEFYEYAD